MAASFLSLAERAVIEIRKGAFEALFMKGTDGNIITLHVHDPDLNLVVIFETSRDVSLSLLSLEYLREVAKDVLFSMLESQMRY